MIDLYISKNIYDTCQEGTDLYLLLHNNATQIWLDIDGSELDELIASQNGDELTESKNQDNENLRSGKIMLDCMKEGKPIKHGLSKAIVILDDITEDKAKEISQQYGILCLTFKQISTLWKKLKTKSKYTTRFYSEEEKEAYKEENKIDFPIGKGAGPDTSEKKGWNYFFAPFNSIPCNTLVFIDRFLKNDKYCNNIKNIILENIEGSPRSIPIHLLMICGENTVDALDKIYKKRILPKLTEITKNKFGREYLPLIQEIAINHKCEFIFEFVFVDDTTKDPLYTDIHNRHIYSNYWSLDVPYELNAFSYYYDQLQHANKTQKIEVQGLFVDGFDNNEYIQSEEDAQNTVLETLANDFKGGFTPLDEITKIGNNRRAYRAFLINENECKRINNTQNIIIYNRLIMDKINLKNGEVCKYLSLPYCNDWKNISTKQGEYKENGEYENCIVVKTTDSKTLKNMIKEIKELFTDNKYPQVDGEYGHYYRIVTTYPSDLKTIHVISSKQCEKPCNQYEGNRFKNVSDAMEMCNEIAKKLGLEEKYSEDTIKKVKDIISRSYLFHPYIPTKNFSYGEEKIRILIIGASHNCHHSTDCPYYCDCTSCDIFMGNSKLYNNICPHKDTDDNNQELSLEETTKHTINSFLKNTNDENNKSFRHFTDFMKNYLKMKNIEVTDGDFWNQVAFVNYAQNFESQKTGNHFSDEDFEAFKQYMEIIKPDVVIIWGCDLGNELRKRGVKPGEEDQNIEETEHYYWQVKEGDHSIEFINCNHPCNNMSILEDYGKFSKALDKIFKNNGH